MIESKVFDTLVATTYVTDAVSTRIYPIILPQNSSYPCISYSRLETDKLFHLSGYATLENPHIQINGWAQTYNGIKDLSTRISLAMSSAIGFNCRLISEIDVMDVNENKEVLYRVTQDYSCWNKE